MPISLKKVGKKLGILDAVDESYKQNFKDQPTTTPQAAPASKAATPALTPEQELKAQRVLIKTYEQSWGKIDTKFAEITPMGAVANAGDMTHSKYVALQNAWNTTIGYFAQTAGNEYLASYILSMGLNDDQQRQATLSALTKIITGGVLASDPAKASTVIPGGGPVAQSAKPGEAGLAGMEQKQLTPEKFGQVVADPSKFASLSYHEQQQFIHEAQGVIKAYQGRGQQAEALQRAVAAVATGDVTQALSGAEASELQRWVKDVKAGRTPGPGNMPTWQAGELAAPGSIEQIAEGGDIIRLDAEWARQHPAKAAAEAYYLQQQFPDAKVEFGRDGIVGTLMTGLGKPIDVVMAIPSAVINITEDKIRQAIDDGNPAELKAQRDSLAARLKTADMADREDILHTIDKLNDRIGIVTGEQDMGFMDMVDRSINSDTANLGFAENIVQGGGLLPGDTGYEAAIGTTMLVGAVIADPIMWSVGVAQGVRAASQIPKIAEAGYEGGRAVRGLIARYVYNRMAVTPEEFMEGAAGMGAAEKLAKAAATWKPEEYDFFLQQFMPDPAARNFLRAAGSDPAAIQRTLTHIMSGYTEGKDVVALSNRINTLGERLNEGDALIQAQKASQGVIDAGHTGAMDRLEQHIAELEDAGLVDTAEYHAATMELADLSAAGPPRAAPAMGASVPKVQLRGQLLNKSGEVVGDINPAEVSYVRTEDILHNTVYESRVTTGDMAYSPEKAAEFKAYVRENGFPGPVTVMVDVGAPTPYRVIDGNHRLQIASELGMEYIPVRAVSPLDPTIPMHIRASMAEPFAGRNLTDLNPTLFRGVEAADPIADMARLDELLASRLDDKAEMAWLKNVQSGKTTEAMPLDFGDLKEMSKSSTSWGRAFGTVADDLGDFPRGFLDVATAGRLRGKAKNLWRGLSIMFNPTGLEGAEAAAGKLMRAIWLPGVRAPEGALVDLFERSRESLTNVGRLLHVPEADIVSWMGQWDDLVALGSREESFKWLTGYWNHLITKSPKIEAALKPGLSRLYTSSFEQWGSDVVRTSAPGAYAVHEPVAYKTITDPASGALLKAGQPVFSADLLSHGVFLPDMNAVLEAMYPALMKTLNGKKLTAASSMWKRVILSPKLPFALPARITGELLLARMSAYDLASMGNWGVVSWMKSVKGVDEFARFADDPAYALGSMLNDLEMEGRLTNRATNLGILNSTAGTDYYRALAGRYGHIVSSPETRLILDASTPELFVAGLKSDKAPAVLQEMAAHWSTMEGGLDATATKVWNYVHANVVGTGDFAEEIRLALKTGKLADGTEVGTVQFANRLEAEARMGNWYPGMTEVHGKFAVGLLEAVDTNAITRANNWLFRTFYTRPEAGLGRIPAYRQLAVRYSNRLMKMGYPEEVALDIARSTAARDTADMFFKIGAHTSGELFMRNVSPFFPAWREVTTTWLSKLPERLGGGSKILGGIYMARRGQVLFDVLSHWGVVFRGPNGDLRINMGFLDPVVNAILPLPEGERVHVTVAFDSLFGILPFPSLDATNWRDAVSAMLPGLGGGIGVPTQLLANKVLDQTHPGWQRDIADLLLPYGQTDFAGNWSRLYASMALMTGHDPVPPWEKFASPEWKEAAINSSIDDAMRTLVSSGDPKYIAPNAKDYNLDTPKGTAEFTADYKAWQERLLGDATHLAGTSLLTRSVFSTILPFAAKWTTEEQDSITAIWALVNGEQLPENLRNQAMSPLLEQFHIAYPEADWWTVGKTEALGERQQTDADVELQDLFNAGLVRIRTPQEYATWAMGMNSFQAYMAKKQAAYATVHNNPVEYLLNGDRVRERIAKLDGQWQAFLTASDLAAKADGVTSFRTLFDKTMETEGKSVSDVQLQALARTLPILQDKVESGTYSEVKAAIYNAIGDAKRNSSGAEYTMWTTIDKWYNKVADPYYSHLDKLYKQVNALPENDPRAAGIYDQIRHYTSTVKPKTIDGIKMPTPEQVSFFTKSPDEQAALATRKLAYGHPEWLTPFYQETLGFGKGPRTFQFTNFVSEQEQAFKKQYPSYYSPGYDHARDVLDRVEAQKAKEMGVNWQLWNAPLYKKMSNAGLGTGQAWDAAIRFADQAWKSITSRGYTSASSTSPNAFADQKWLMSHLETLYKSDEDFARTIDNAAVGLAEDPATPVSREDVFWRVFFDGYGSAPATLFS